MAPRQPPLATAVVIISGTREVGSRCTPLATAGRTIKARHFCLLPPSFNDYAALPDRCRTIGEIRSYARGLVGMSGASHSGAPFENVLESLKPPADLRATGA
jgi:hypothetical protein